MWHDVKLLIEQYTGLDRDVLHIHGALGLYLLALILFRCGPTSFKPWLFVLAPEMLNETADLFGLYTAYGIKETIGTVAFADSIKDIWNTMLWPSVAFLAARFVAATNEKQRGLEPGLE